MRMSTSKKMELSGASGAEGVVREIAKAENKFQEELNRAFTNLAEGSFKALRRPLPVTRQKVEWEKIGGYRVRVDFTLLLCVGNLANLMTVGPGYWWRTIKVIAVLLAHAQEHVRSTLRAERKRCTLSIAQEQRHRSHEMTLQRQTGSFSPSAHMLSLSKF